MNKLYLCFILFFIGFTFSAKSQLLINQCESISPCNALPICSNYIVSNFSFNTTGSVSPIATCNSATGTFAYTPQWVYYRFTCNTPGQLKFRLMPNDSLTTFSDLDWAVWDITLSGCSTLSALNVVECNAAGSGPSGILTGGTPVANYEPNLNLVAGNTYIIGICNSTGLNTNGFTLNFDGTTASIFDNKQPYLQSISPFNPCLPVSSIQINLSEPVRCGQLNASTDLIFSSPIPSFTQSTGAACPGCMNTSPNIAANYSNLTNSITLNFATALTPGTYTVSTVTNAFTDICGNPDSTSPTLTFTVGGTLGIDVHTGFDCVNQKYLDTVFATNTSLPYQYKALGGGLSTSFSTYGAFVSTYTVYSVFGGIAATYFVKDLAGCEVATTITHSTVLSLQAPNLSNSASPPCFNQFSLDSIYVSPITGGLPPYLYALNPFYTGTTFSTLSTGAAVWKNINLSTSSATFTVTVTDALGCSRTSIRQLNNPTPITLMSSSSTNATCNGGLGSICCAISGGTPLYHLSVFPSTSATSYTTAMIPCATNLPANTYLVTALDANGCSITLTKTISQPTAINIVNTSSTIVKPTCSGLCNGSYQPISTGGIGNKKYYLLPYVGPGTYSYTDSVVTSVAPNNRFKNLCVGNYTVLAVDALGCSSMVVVSITPLNPTPISYGYVTACGSYTLGGTTYTVSTVVNETLVAASGCDSIHQTSLNIDPLPTVVSTNVSGCSGSPITLIGSPAGGIFTQPNPYTGPSTTYNYMYTDGNGCTGISPTSTISVTPCLVSVNLKLFIQGYYLGSSLMTPSLFNQGVLPSNTIADLITIELHQSSAPYALVDSKTAFLNVNGNVSCSFNASPGNYYIVIKGRNVLETWSANPVSLSATAINYNFSNAANKAYGSNMILMSPGVWAMYSGEIEMDQNIDLMDMNILANDVVTFVYGYVATDLNGDSNVDLSDLFIVSENINNFIYSMTP